MNQYMTPNRENHKCRKEEDPMVTNNNEKKLGKYYYAMAPEITSLKASLSTKASPIFLKSWIAMVSTLDGRDKVTKAIQYASRLLAHYYETKGIAHRNTTQHLSATTYLLSKARRWRNLQASLTKSRKAFRFGRSLIEFEKLRSIGFGHWVAWHLRQMVLHSTIPADNVYVRNDLLTEKQSQAVDRSDTDDDDDNDDGDNDGDNDDDDDDSRRERKKAETEIEGKHADFSHKKESTISWHTDTKFDQDEGNLYAQNDKILLHPPPMRLPKRVSSNLGPPTTILSKREGSRRYYHQLSSSQRFAYISLSTYIDEGKAHIAAPPLWKIISSAAKLLGLAGFWAADNVSYLYSSGFLNDARKGRSTAKDASIFAARAYFFASVSGLYLNWRECLRHRNGPLADKWCELQEHRMNMQTLSVEKNEANGEHSRGRYVMTQLEAELEKAKQKYGNLCIALLKVSHHCTARHIASLCIHTELNCVLYRCNIYTIELLRCSCL
jgi:hypothetical protein